MKNGAKRVEAALISFFSESDHGCKPKDGILIACSGGPDSVALVRALKNISVSHPYRFYVGHVNHELRGRESEGDARFVRTLAQEVGWPVHVIRKPVKRLNGNLEEVAREKRYQALTMMAQRSKSRLILTAHTLDDQIETIFMNMLRGAGPDGLGGMWPVRSLDGRGVRIGRPFLTVTKKQIADYLRNGGFAYRKDRSNRNEKLMRNWMRKRVMPLLESRSPGFKGRIANLADLMREEQAYWNEFLPPLRRRLLRSYRGGELLDFKKVLIYPPAVQRRFLRQALGGDVMSFDAIERLRRWMGAPPTSGRIWQLRKGWIAERLSKSTGSPSTSLFWLRQSRTK